MSDPDSLRACWLERLLPLWRDHGTDRAGGGFWNRLQPDLRPVDEDHKRLLVQLRQIFSFSLAARRGAPDWALETALHGFAFLRRAYADEVLGGWFLTATPGGEPLDRTKDLYAHAFVVLALSQLHRAGGPPEALALAEETWQLTRARLAEPHHGGFLDRADADWTPQPRPRRQNPHMHWFEALLGLADASDDPAPALAAAAEILDLCEQKFSNAEGVLYEYFADDWTPLAGEAQAVEPGHGFEWVWLLHEFHRRRAEPRALELASRLFAFAERHGTDPDGAVCDGLDATGRVVVSDQRLWPQTERVKALAVQDGGSARAARTAARALAAVMDRYVDWTHGGWREHLDAGGRVISDAMNATSVYHVLLALVEVEDALRRA